MVPAASSPRRREPAPVQPRAGSMPEQQLVAALISLLEQGTTPWRRPWDDGQGGHHVNLLSGRRYRGANPALLSLGMHLRASTLPYWCGFVEARALGLAPRKGSKAVHILRPHSHRRGDADAADLPAAAAGSEPAPDQRADQGAAANGSGAAATARVWVSYRPVAVFNAADLEGDGLAGLVAARRHQAGLDSRSEPERLQAAEAALAGWPVPVRHGGDRACYLPELDQIRLPERSAFHSTAALYATWAHEGIHSTGHRSRLGRDLSGLQGSRAYAREELVAELGAVLVGDRLEIGSDVRHHAAYLGAWIELLRETPRVLLQVLSEARRAADLLVPEAEATNPLPAGDGSGET